MLKVASIFTSVDGEVNSLGQGAITTFIRLAGCNLRCHYCDTKFAQKVESGKEMHLEDILKQVNTLKVTITGGEPLTQNLKRLLVLLKMEGHIISIETNGSLSVHSIIPFVDCIIADVKHKDIYRSANVNLGSVKHTIRSLRSCDWVKFVIGSKEEFLDSVQTFNYIERDCFGGINGQMIKANIAFSPYGDFFSKELISLILDHMPVKERNVSLNVQIHKLLGLSEDQDRSPKRRRKHG